MFTKASPAVHPPVGWRTDGLPTVAASNPDGSGGGYEMVDGLGATKDGRNVTVCVNQEPRYGRRR
jgi:hypothetical protein